MQSSVCSSRGNVTERLIKSAKPTSQDKLPLFVALYEYRKAYQLAPLSWMSLDFQAMGPFLEGH